MNQNHCPNANRFAMKLVTALTLLMLGTSVAPAQTLLSYWNFNNDATSFTSTAPNTATFNTTAATYGEAYNTTTSRLASNTAGLYHDSSVYLDMSYMVSQGATYGGATSTFSFGVYSDTTVNRIASDTTGAGSLLTSGQALVPMVLDFNLNSSGYQNLSFSFALRNQLPNTVTASYSTDGGTTFNLITTYSTATSGFQLQTLDLSSISALNNDAAFILRVSSHLSSSSVALDNVQFTGIAIPEPATWTYLSVAGVLFLWMARRRKSVPATQTI